jgi:hypothetical protein
MGYAVAEEGTSGSKRFLNVSLSEMRAAIIAGGWQSGNRIVSVAASANLAPKAVLVGSPMTGPIGWSGLNVSAAPVVVPAGAMSR